LRTPITMARFVRSMIFPSTFQSAACIRRQTITAGALFDQPGRAGAVLREMFAFIQHLFFHHRTAI
jgi:hypothetical protein